MAPSACYLGRIPDFSHLSVGYRVDCVIGLARLRNFHGARMPGAAEVRVAAGIADISPVDNHGVVVQAGCQRRGRGSPESIRLLQHVDFGAAPEVQSDLRGIGSLDPNLNSRPDVSTRGYSEPHTLVVAGWKSAEVWAQAGRASSQRDERKDQPHCSPSRRPWMVALSLYGEPGRNTILRQNFSYILDNMSRESAPDIEDPGDRQSRPRGSVGARTGAVAYDHRFDSGEDLCKGHA